MRLIRKIILHASGRTDDTLRSLDRRHRARGLRSVGFHYVIRTDGTLERGRDLSVSGAHCLGFNADSIGVCLCGGGEPTAQQLGKLTALLHRVARRFPGATLHRVGELDPWIADPLRLDLDALRDAIQPQYNYDRAVRDWIHYIL